MFNDFASIHRQFKLLLCNSYFSYSYLISETLSDAFTRMTLPSFLPYVGKFQIRALQLAMQAVKDNPNHPQPLLTRAFIVEALLSGETIWSNTSGSAINKPDTPSQEALTLLGCDDAVSVVLFALKDYEIILGKYDGKKNDTLSLTKFFIHKFIARIFCSDYLTAEKEEFHFNKKKKQNFVKKALKNSPTFSK